MTKKPKPPTRHLGTFTRGPIAVKLTQKDGTYVAEIHTYDPAALTSRPSKFAIIAKDNSDARIQSLNLLDDLRHIYKTGAESESKPDPTAWLPEFSEDTAGLAPPPVIYYTGNLQKESKWTVGGTLPLAQFALRRYLNANTLSEIYD
jgi:hypothetical protein